MVGILDSFSLGPLAYFQDPLLLVSGSVYPILKSPFPKQTIKNHFQWVALLGLFGAQWP